MENTVDMMLDSQVQDDAAQTVDATPTLSDVLGTEAVSTPEQGPAQTEEPKEAGWIKTRIQKGVEKELAAVEARIRAEYEAQFAPMRDAYMAQEADKLVASGKIADREMALEYLKLRGGQPVTKQAPQQPRDEQGRFTAQPANNDAQQRARDLYTQSQTIKKATGVDVMAIYNTDPEIRQKVLSGEWDFGDVYASANQPDRPPAPVRSANGSGVGNANFRKMSSADLAKVNAMLESGGRIDMRR